ncbi:hypothetical protein KPG71_18915 [Roseovarius sp. PS-C2]|uniref:hypothetical protein n=1 Tax=Roseovarius sp. PS-C2 TaxID=2820814 RepID=UPI001C0BEE46|nr:hypothetical protein [Roseovarius sp. PS-C2]MBU3262098.1 hypothetical protein [Roseovarius sp. PS-C2]
MTDTRLHNDCDGGQCVACASDARSDQYLIVKRNLYYRPNAHGYTGIKEEAGRYTLAEVAVHFPNMDSPNQDGMTYIHEDDAPDYSPACCHDIRSRHQEKKARETKEALKLALPVMRSDLCCMVETCCRSDIGPVNDHTPPQPRSMDETMLPYAKACIAAINAANSQVETPADGQPEWLDQVIAGRIKL